MQTKSKSIRIHKTKQQFLARNRRSGRPVVVPVLAHLQSLLQLYVREGFGRLHWHGCFMPRAKCQCNSPWRRTRVFMFLLHVGRNGLSPTLSGRPWTSDRAMTRECNQYSSDMWMNCAFYDTSMKFRTHIDFIISKIFGYKAISDFALEGVGGHFPRWPP